MRRIAALGCCVCRFRLGLHDSPAAIHHVRDGYGKSQRAPNTDIIPLCGMHHQNGGYGVAFHAGKTIWQDRFGTERELQALVHEQYRQEYNEEPLPPF